MSEREGERLDVRSSVKVEANAKGFPQVRVSVYAGETEQEMERLKNLAVASFQKTCAMLGVPSLDQEVTPRR